MEELQVIETTSGRQFKPWASKEDVQAIGQAVVQAVLNPASVTAVAVQYANSRIILRQALDAKGVEYDENASLEDLARLCVTEIVNVGISSEGVALSSPMKLSPLFSIGYNSNNTIESINDLTPISIAGFCFYENATITTLTLGVTSINNVYNFCYCQKLKEINLPLLNNNHSDFFCCNNPLLKKASFKTSNTWDRYSFNNCPLLEEIEFGRLTYAYIWNSCINDYNIKKIIIGADTNISIDLTRIGNTLQWDNNVSADEFDYNMRHFFFENLKDNSQSGTTKTITLSSYALAKISQETITYVTNKGWIIA